MYEVTCFHCGHIANISPDAERCAVCGMDLKHLITPEYASRYFYDRAAEMAAAGEVTLALMEVERGLNYRRTAELHLLAAILSQRLGNLEQMRHHVAAIPVDDVLRPEAEWLLRSQQTGLRTSAQAGGSAPQPRRQPIPAVAPAIWNPPPAQRPPQPTRQPLNGFLYATLAVLLVVFIGWVGFGSGADILTRLFPSSAPATQERAEPITPPLGEATTPVIAPSQTLLTNTLPVTVTLPTVTPNVPPNLVQTTPEPVAAAPAQGGNGINPQSYDLASYLRQTNRPELADLEVAATLQGVTLTLRGVVSLYDERQSLIDLAQRAPAVGQVDAAELLVRLPPTYTVQTGDTLWFISYKLYGDNRVADLYAANRAVLPSPESLTAGQVLQVPRDE